MKRTTLCSVINLTLLGLVWGAIVSVPNLIAGRLLTWWINVLLVVFGLIVAGYLTQYVLSPVVNRTVMREKHHNEREPPDGRGCRKGCNDHVPRNGGSGRS